LEQEMGDCLKGKSKVKKKDAKFQCEKCEAYSAKKGQVCKPEKVKPSDKKKKSRK
jgi:hypothetical protein